MAVLTSTISGTLLGANYSGGTGTPTASDDLYLANNMTLSGGTATVNSIQQQGSGTLTIASSSATINAAINRTGSANFIFIGNGLTLTVNGAFSETGSGGWGIYGNANSSSGNLILNGQLTHNGAAYPMLPWRASHGPIEATGNLVRRTCVTCRFSTWVEGTSF